MFRKKCKRFYKKRVILFIFFRPISKKLFYETDKSNVLTVLCEKTVFEMGLYQKMCQR
jgi:hypothetical protein